MFPAGHGHEATATDRRCRRALTISKKVCLLGEFGVGKTSLVRRAVYRRFDERYISTIGVQVTRKQLLVKRAGVPAELALMLWDLAGGDGADMIRASYLSGAAAAVLVGDLTRPQTFQRLPHYLDLFYGQNPQGQVVLAANKADLVDTSDPHMWDGAALHLSLGAPVFLCSAKTGGQVEELFALLAGLLAG